VCKVCVVLDHVADLSSLLLSVRLPFFEPILLSIVCMFLLCPCKLLHLVFRLAALAVVGSGHGLKVLRVELRGIHRIVRLNASFALICGFTWIGGPAHPLGLVRPVCGGCLDFLSPVDVDIWVSLFLSLPSVLCLCY